MDSSTSVEQLKDLVKKFCSERDWDQFHTAKDLAIGLITEASEVLEHFRFQSESDVKELFASPARKEQIEDELADTLFFILRFGERYNIDLATVMARKLEKNALKYPVEKCRGLNKKYTELN
ncbi:MAG: nucleotide pyrophosphohydrolase [Oligoflexales bacterium]